MYPSYLSLNSQDRMVRCRNLVVLIVAVSVLQVVRSSTTVRDINQDRAECTDSLIGMATCLPYVGGEAKAPTMDCCSGLKQVLSKSLKCLCILIKDRDDPSLGLKINSTLALSLPDKCHHSPVNLTQCIGKYSRNHLSLINHKIRGKNTFSLSK